MGVDAAKGGNKKRTDERGRQNMFVFFLNRRDTPDADINR
jgi:hypothetical protein